MKRNADKNKEDRKNVEKVKESEDDFAFSIIKESGHFKLLDSEGEIKLVNMTLLIDGKPTDPSIVYAKQKDLVRYRVSKVTKQLYFITEKLFQEREVTMRKQDERELKVRKSEKVSVMRFSITEKAGCFKLFNSADEEIRLQNSEVYIDQKLTDLPTVYAKQKDLVRYKVCGGKIMFTSKEKFTELNLYRR